MGVILKNGHIVSFGDTHMVIGLVLEKVPKKTSEAVGSTRLNQVQEKTL